MNLEEERDAYRCAIEWVLQSDDDNDYKGASVYFSERDSVPVLSILMSDTFAYASSDAEDIPWEEVVSLRKDIEVHGWPAGVRWAMKKRGYDPIEPVLKLMKEYEAEHETNLG